MTDIKNIQKAELVLLKDIVHAFEKHNIKYYLGFGTLLGAIRHSGFIPWDDDIDLFVPRNDFERIKNDRNNIIPIPYILSGNINKTSIIIRVENPKIQFYIEKNGAYIEKNIWIDIFPIDGLPSSRIGRFIFFVRIRVQYVLLRFARSSVQGVSIASSRSLLEFFAIKVNKLFSLGTLFCREKIIDRLDRIRTKYHYDNSQFVCPLTFDYMEKCVCKKKWFGEGIVVDFENIMVNIPNDSDSILKQIYGDYLQLPPEEKRQPKHIVIMKTDI